MIVQLTMTTANSVEVLGRLPLGELWALYRAVAAELEEVTKRHDEA